MSTFFIRVKLLKIKGSMDAKGEDYYNFLLLKCSLTCRQCWVRSLSIHTGSLAVVSKELPPELTLQKIGSETTKLFDALCAMHLCRESH